MFPETDMKRKFHIRFFLPFHQCHNELTIYLWISKKKMV